jgi:membrane protein implicated in regulation of membrane protease activity
MPLALSELLLLILIPGGLFIVLLSDALGAAPLFFVKPWLNGLGLGLAASVAYYGPKDLQRNWKRRRYSLPKVRDDA